MSNAEAQPDDTVITLNKEHLLYQFKGSVTTKQLMRHMLRDKALTLRTRIRAPLL